MVSNMTPTRPSQIQKPKKLQLERFDADAYENISLRLHGDDAMYWHNPAHYLSVGASALNAIQGVQAIAGIAGFGRILDFGSGAGRVTRWLRAAYPSAALTVADVRQADLDFCAETFAAETWNSGINIEAMRAPSLYDLIWVGSVVTHLSEVKTTDLLQRLAEWLNVNGLALLSFHGRSAFSWRSRLSYVPSDLLPEIERAFEDTGYGYSDYPNRTGYGISFCSLLWMVSSVQRVSQCRLLTLSERAWDGHHDIVALQRVT
jgi:2-polyprenyl-3-methyl-5-hydroxy-6-metoxy-1,4-benzoquinol methylase